MKESNNRVEAISDAMFAFAATLVVVSLEVPDNFVDLSANLWRFFPFALSFFGLMMVWNAHYRFFRRVEHIDGWVVAFNFGMLFVVLFFVYPLKFLANLAFGQARIEGWDQLGELFALYSMGFSTIFAFLALMYARASVLTVRTGRAELRYRARHFLIYVIVGSLSIVLALSGVGVRFGLPGFMYVILGPICYLHRVKTYPEAS